MRTTFAMHLQVTPKNGQSARDCFDDLKTCLSTWITSTYERKGAISPEWIPDKPFEVPENGETVIIRPAHSVSGRLHVLGDAELMRVEWVQPQDKDTTWSTISTVARLADTVEFSVVTGIQSVDAVLKPIRYVIGLPRIIRDILASYQTRVAGWPVQKGLTTLHPPDIASFVSNVLFNTSRKVPVILYTAT